MQFKVGGLYAYKGCPCAKCLAVGNEFAFMSATSYQNEFLLDDDDLVENGGKWSLVMEKVSDK